MELYCRMMFKMIQPFDNYYSSTIIDYFIVKDSWNTHNVTREEVRRNVRESKISEHM